MCIYIYIYIYIYKRKHRYHKQKTEALSDAVKEVGLEVNPAKTKYM
jgi:hypothetical protein